MHVFRYAASCCAWIMTDDKSAWGLGISQPVSCGLSIFIFGLEVAIIFKTEEDICYSISLRA